MAAYMSVALNHLWQWVDKGTVPPRADRILVDRNEANDGSVMALDEHGNASGGIRNPYVDVPAKKYGVRNEGAVPPIPNAHPFVAVRDAGSTDSAVRTCRLRDALTPAQLKKLYKDPKTTSRQRGEAARRADEAGLVAAGLPRCDSRGRRRRELLEKDRTQGAAEGTEHGSRRHAGERESTSWL